MGEKPNITPNSSRITTSHPKECDEHDDDDHGHRIGGFALFPAMNLVVPTTKTNALTSRPNAQCEQQSRTNTKQYGYEKTSGDSTISSESPLVYVCGRRCPTLPHPPGCSTIGVGWLSFRVRNGSGRFPTAIATDTIVQGLFNSWVVVHAHVCACVWCV